MKTILSLSVLAALSLLACVPSVLADGAGLSGQCYNADASSGGEDELRVDTESGVNAELEPQPNKGGITDGLAMFALGTIEDGGQTGGACDRYDCFAEPEVCAQNGQDSRFDYIEVDATVGGNFVQVCYRGAASIAGDCPKGPTGQGA